MTESPNTPTPGPVVQSAGTKGWVKILLALSLAANLAVVGMVAGAALKFHGQDVHGPSGSRDMAFGPYSDALNRAQRRALWNKVQERGTGLGNIREELRSDMDAVLTALRATPFDPGAFQSALEQQNMHLSKRVAEGREGLVGVVLAMTDQERAEFAGNLERRLKQRRSRD